MDKIKPTIRSSAKTKIKRLGKRILQPFFISQKDYGKKVYFNALKKPVKENYIFYEAFAGLGILDNPRAIFKALLSDARFSDFVHVWAIDDLELAGPNTQEFSSLDNVFIVKRASSAYYEFLATCGYLIANTTFGYFFEKRPEQVYINTWHGVPTKYMGYEHAVERVENARGPARHFLSADYLLSSNRFMTDIMYRRSYKLDELFEGRLLEIGTPRIDCLISPDKKYVYEKLNRLGIQTDKKIILYAPTWKGNLYDRLDYDINGLKQLVCRFADAVNRDEYRIYLRVHYFLYRILAKDSSLRDFLIPFTVDTNELLSVVDVLISDYSSIFFDYLVTGKPMIFYVPDLEQYETGRGLYVPTDTLPGLVSSEQEEVCQALSLITKTPDDYLKTYQKRYQAMRSWCTYNEDGKSCKRLIDIVFKKLFLPEEDLALREDVSEFYLRQYQRATSGIYAFEGFCQNKTRLLICFNTRVNQDTHYDELLKYLETVDFEKTDVTLLVTSFKDEKNKQYFNHLPAEVRILVWYALPFCIRETKKFFAHEVRRTLGSMQFDEIKMIGNVTKYWAGFANAVLSRF